MLPHAIDGVYVNFLVNDLERVGLGSTDARAAR
jgi:hypothetical protein